MDLKEAFEKAMNSEIEGRELYTEAAERSRDDRTQVGDGIFRGRLFYRE